MSLPQGYRPRDGDVVVLHGQVQFDFDSTDKSVHIKIDGDFGTRMIALEKIVAIRRRIWHDGEQVRHRNIENCFGTVAAMSGDHVWIKMGDGSAHTKRTLGGFMTVHCNEIEPNEAPPPAEIPALDRLQQQAQEHLSTVPKESHDVE